MMFTKVEISILSLLILYYAQDFFLNLVKEDLVQNEFSDELPDEDNVCHYIITGVRIISSPQSS